MARQLSRAKSPAPRAVRNEIIVFTLIALGMVNLLIIVLGPATYDASPMNQDFGVIASIAPINLSESLGSSNAPAARPVIPRRHTSADKQVAARSKRLLDEVPPVRHGCITVVGTVDTFDPLKDMGPPPPLPSFIPARMPEVLPNEVPPASPFSCRTLAFGSC